MMAYTYDTTFTASDVLSGKGVKTTGKWIFTNQDSLKQIRRFHVDTTEFSETLTTAQLQASFLFRCPRYARPGGTDKFEFRQMLWATGGGTAHLRVDLNDGTNTTTGTEITAVAATATVMSGPSRADIPTLMLSDNISGLLRIYLWVTGGGTGFTSADNLLFNCGINS